MALNCAMLRPGTPPRPVPLPDEKTFLVVAGVQAVLHPMANSSTLAGDSKAGLSALGSVSVTSLRIVFISAAARAGTDGSPSTTSAGKPKELHSLSVNLSHFQDGRFVQPWFGANCYESLVLPQHGGGLNILHNLKLHFNEGRAFEFYEAVEQVKARYDEARGRAGRAPEEALPLYTPPGGSAAPSSSSSAPSMPAVTQSHPHREPHAGPDAAQLEAATCARQAEAAEDASAVVAATSSQTDTGLPPAYEAGSRP